MSKKEQKRETLPGVVYSRFKIAVDVLQGLQRAGKILLFLSQRMGVRVIGDTHEFHREFAQKLQEESMEDAEIEKTESEEVLTEIRKFLATWAEFRSLKPMLRFLEEAVMDDDFNELSEDGKSHLRTLLEDKTKLVADKLFSGSMTHRAIRIDTATGPCMEDLDVEVVSEREDRLEDSHVTDPFLRLRLRYSEGGCLPFRLFRFSFGPRAAFAETKSFDFECDETDIDLLLLRLKAAKELLLRKTARDVREPPA